MTIMLVMATLSDIQIVYQPNITLSYNQILQGPWKEDLWIITSVFQVIEMVPLTSTYANIAWWCHEMKTFSALLALSTGNSPVPSEFPPELWCFLRSASE